MTYLTVAQAAERLQVCQKTIRRRIHDGTLPALSTGSGYRIVEEEMVEALRFRPIRETAPDPMPRPTRSTFDDQLAAKREERRRRAA